MRLRSSLIDIPIDEPFKNDALGRKTQIEALTRFVGNVEGPCVLAVDGAWGSGKTVFLRMWAQVLRGDEAVGFDVVKFNAWDTDFSEDPLMALYAAMESSLKRGRDYKSVLEVVGRAVSTMASACLPVPDVVEVVESSLNAARSSTAERLRRFRDAQEAIGDVKKSLEEVAGSGRRLVVCVDELDRCRPDYAIRFLEATKHIFDAEGVIFVLAVNMSELANSVRALYGGGFDAPKYLRRFVDHIVYLRTDVSRYKDHLLQQSELAKGQNNSEMAHYLREILTTLVVPAPDLGLRDLEQAMCHLRVVLGALLWDTYSYVTVVALTMMVFRIVVPETYQEFKRGDITDLDALEALNRKIRRSDGWWRDKHIQPFLPDVDVDVERALIAWGRYVKGDPYAASPLLDKRERQRKDDPNQETESSRFLAGVTDPSSIAPWSEVGKAFEIVEMVTYKPE